MQIDKEWLNSARDVVGDQGVFTSESDIESYSRDETATDEFARLPAAVLKPASEKEAAGIVKLCHATGIPITARGGGTGLSAGCVPADGGIVLSMERLNKVIHADAADHTITVQAGVTLESLYREVENIGLFFPPHPGDESAMIGGVAATNAGGARAVKYGTVRRFVLGLQVILADGRIAEFGGRYIKTSTGYNMMELMIGSEGTLGIITRVTLNLLPKPGSIQTLVVPFESVSKAIRTVPSISKLGIIPFAVEFLEHSTIACSEKLLNKQWPTHDGTASLMIILDGVNEDFVMAQAEQLAEVMDEQGALDVLIADQKDRQADILEIRSMLYEALRPGTAELLDICVPRSEIADHVEFVHEVERKYRLPLPTYGHAADGNVHTQVMNRYLENGEFGDEIPNWREAYEKVRKDIYQDAIQRGGVISGEHGVGLLKLDYIAENLGEANIDMMRAIKKAMDPLGIFNPGKVIRLS
ncbi:MAG: FAD-binding oxidoreductase [Spirochaetales bacterium]|jgi:glycolate oxidase|nr:FAD-binding oxidoreductase [Spirochaetales bacterium]